MVARTVGVLLRPGVTDWDPLWHLEHDARPAGQDVACALCDCNVMSPGPRTSAKGNGEEVFHRQYLRNALVLVR